MDKRENCGLIGIYGDPDAAEKTFFALHSLQHRGQESAGIATANGDNILCHTGMGHVSRVFRSGQAVLNQLRNPISIGHVRYSTSGSWNLANAQPLLCEYSRGQVAVAHNGNLINASLLGMSTRLTEIFSKPQTILKLSFIFWQSHRMFPSRIRWVMFLIICREHILCCFYLQTGLRRQETHSA